MLYCEFGQLRDQDRMLEKARASMKGELVELNAKLDQAYPFRNRFRIVGRLAG